jgi:RNA polymerase sigma-70 factor, ECF subfamily
MRSRQSGNTSNPRAVIDQRDSDDVTSLARETQHDRDIEGGDADAVQRAVAGDAAAFSELVHRHTAAAYGVARAVVESDADAEDVVQDAFLLAYRELHTARDAAKFRPWLLRIVRNRAYNVIEFRRVRRHEVLSGYEPAPADADPSAIAERNDQRAAILAAVAKLKPAHREVFWLYDVEGFNHDEIADLLGISAGMSRKHLMNARRHLQRELQHYRIDR